MIPISKELAIMILFFGELSTAIPDFEELTKMIPVFEELPTLIPVLYYLRCCQDIKQQRITSLMGI